MKRQRNTQQVKEQDKCPPNETKEEEIGNRPDKEFRIMIVIMIQNLEIKMYPDIVKCPPKCKITAQGRTTAMESIEKKSQC